MPPPGRSRWSASAAGLVTGSSAPGTPDACPPPSMPRPAAGESPMPARISAAGCGSSACLAAHLMAHRDVLFAVLRELWPRNRSPPWLTTVRRAHARRLRQRPGLARLIDAGVVNSGLVHPGAARSTAKSGGPLPQAIGPWQPWPASPCPLGGEDRPPAPSRRLPDRRRAVGSPQP